MSASSECIAAALSETGYNRGTIMFSSRSLLALTATLLAGTASVAAAETFNRIASFPVELNNPEAETSSAEIITATDDGMTLIYSDSPAGGIGFVDITDAKAPKQGGFIDMGGEPTSVTVIGGKAYVAVNTSESYTEPSGKLVVVDVVGKSIDAEFDLGGQPVVTLSDPEARLGAGDIVSLSLNKPLFFDADGGRVAA